MTNFLRYSYVAIQVIPENKRFLLHSTYEDNDLEGHNAAEKHIDLIAYLFPGMNVAVLANDSVYPKCEIIPGEEAKHYGCDFYEPMWYILLIKKEIWEEYKEHVEEKQKAWEEEHGCQVQKNTGHS